MSSISPTSILQQLLQKDVSTSTSSQQSAVPSLASALAAATSATSSTGAANPTDSVNLSPEAKAYLERMNAIQSVNATSGSTFVLSREQQDLINDIVAKYKDAPYTQETFDAIKADLEKVGLSTKVMAAQDEARNFNPTQFFLDVLNGTDATGSNALEQMLGKTDSAASEEKTKNFLADVLSRWQRISTTMDES